MGPTSQNKNTYQQHGKTNSQQQNINIIIMQAEPCMPMRITNEREQAHFVASAGSGKYFRHLRQMPLLAEASAAAERELPLDAGVREGLR